MERWPRSLDSGRFARVDSKGGVRNGGALARRAQRAMVMVPPATASRHFSQPAPALPEPRRRSFGTWVIIGIPVLLALVFAWPFASNLLRTESVGRSAVSISRVSLEADPLGSRIDLVLVDRVGRDTTVAGGMNIKLREPDGTVWQTTRGVTPADFMPIQAGALLSGRVGYSVVIPTTDWLRSPRRGGSATVSVSVVPTDGLAFSTVAEERFP